MPESVAMIVGQSSTAKTRALLARSRAQGLTDLLRGCYEARYVILEGYFHCSLMIGKGLFNEPSRRL